MYDWDVQLIHKLYHCLTGMVADSTAACQYHRVFCHHQPDYRILDTLGIRNFNRYRLLFQRFFPRADRHFRNVDRQINMAGAGLFAFCIFKGNPYNFADRIRKDNLLRPLGNWFEHFAKIQKLMGG